MKVSVVVSAFNEEKKLEECLQSVKEIASEIIVIDNSSTDKTSDIAKKYTDKVFKKENLMMLNINKNFGFSKATSEWILNLDADERVTDELVGEILKLDNPALDGFLIPRKNIIFGKWIEHTGWYPDYQLRLFRNGKGRFEEKHVHEMIKVEGLTDKLNSPIMHFNYANLTQFLDKMIKNYTISEAENLIKNEYIFRGLDVFKMPIAEFVKRFFMQKGYKDGMYGLSLSLLMAFYHLVVILRVWEMLKYPEDEDALVLFKEGGEVLKKEVGYWRYQIKIEEESSLLKKNALKLKRKVRL
jgi:glycosyltransferase involved in cell wall biosynthesis